MVYNLGGILTVSPYEAVTPENNGIDTVDFLLFKGQCSDMGLGSVTIVDIKQVQPFNDKVLRSGSDIRGLHARIHSNSSVDIPGYQNRLYERFKI